MKPRLGQLSSETTARRFTRQMAESRIQPRFYSRGMIASRLPYRPDSLVAATPAPVAPFSSALNTSLNVPWV